MQGYNTSRQVNAVKLEPVIKAVLFDLDETLILDEAVSRHAFFVCALSVTRDHAEAQQLAESAEAHAKRIWATLPAPGLEYAARIGHSALEGLWATYDSSIFGEAALQSGIEAYRLETWRASLEECGLEGDPNALQALWQDLRARYPLYPDADELLVQLKSKYKLGIVTNGVAGLQRRKLEGSGLLHWFDAVAISGEVGIGKPERGIFEWVAAELNVPLESCIMVGDNAERDVQGGINAGMRTVWLDRRFKPRGAPATLEVNELLEILPWLETP
jgi:HAD superfamily hydrolase (TIGR01549 family)